MNKIYLGDNLEILRELDDESVDLIYIDPPFNTGKTQKITPIQTVQDKNGDRVGFQGNKYRTIELETKSYNDTFFHDAENLIHEDVYSCYQKIAPWSSIFYLEVFLKPRLIEAKRILKEHGGLYFHIDYREVHYCKILLDGIFGRENFINEIIWAYDFGGRARTRWPAKHDNILFYVMDKEKYIFDQNAVSRIDYMAPGLVGPEKAKRGKIPTDTWFWPNFLSKGMQMSDTWWMSIIGTNSNERTGYPTQKPVKLIDRFLEASTLENFTVLDFFAGSGSTGESCLLKNRNFILIDSNPTALETMALRFSGIEDIEWINFDPSPYQNQKSQLARELSSEQKHSEKHNIKVQDKEFLFFAKTSSDLQENLEKKSNQWKGSPFEWITELPPRTKGKIAREMLIKWLNWKGIELEKLSDSSETIIINNHEYALKFSTLWQSGTYMFQQIKRDGPFFIICFGLSPVKLHLWIINSNLAIEYGNPQHKGADNSEYWISIDPKEIPDWIKQYGDDFNSAISIIKSHRKGKK